MCCKSKTAGIVRAKTLLVLCFFVLLLGANVVGCANHPPTPIQGSRGAAESTASGTAKPIYQASSPIAETPSPVTPSRIVGLEYSSQTRSSPSLSPSLTPHQAASMTAVESPPATDLATATRPSPLTQDSTDYMALSGFLWHPDSARATEGLGINLGDQPWSPEGRCLVGWSQDDQALGLIDLETGNKSLLPSTASLGSAPLWSPNGRYLAYFSRTDRPGPGPLRLALFDLETQNESYLSDSLEVEKLIDLIGWSFDSNRVAFTKWITSAEGILVTAVQLVDIHTMAKSQLNGSSSNPFMEGYWSPTRDQLILLGDSNLPPGMPFLGLEMYAQSTMYLYDLWENRVDEIKTESGLYVSRQPWSLDGKQIIFSDQGVICTLNIDTREESCSTEISEAIVETGSIGAFYPTWSPTGEWIGFILGFESQYCSPVAVIRPDGSDLRFTDAESGDCAVFGPVWSPRH